MTSKNTKRALLTSALSILMCVSMLIGTTFAWFTDTATTNVNKIQAGTLDVALEMWNGTEWVNAEGETLNFKAADGRTDILWEPGCTYELPTLRIVNKGNLALRYQVVISGINGDAELNEAIEWKSCAMFANGTYTYPSNMVGNTLVEGVMYPDEIASDSDWMPASGTFKIIGHMKENAGNEYQGLSIDGISITVVATQAQYEYDSNNKTYDAGAEFPDVWDGKTATAPEMTDGVYHITTAAEFVGLMDQTQGGGASVFTGKKIVLDRDIDLAGHAIKGFGNESCIFGGSFDGQGHTVSNFKVDRAHKDDYAGLFNYYSYGTIENLIVKDATVIGVSKIGALAGNVDNGATVKNCVVENCTVIADRKVGGAIGYTNNATVTGVTVKNTSVYCATNEQAYGKNQWGEVIGYVNVGTTENGNTAINVAVKTGSIAVSTAAELNTAIAKNTQNISIILLNDIAVSSDWAPISYGSYGTYKNIKNLTIDGNSHSIIGLSSSFVEKVSANCTLTVKNLTIKDAVINGGNYSNGMGNGMFVAYVENGDVTLTNCHVVNSKINDNTVSVAALIGYVASSSRENATVSITNSSVKNSEITSSSENAAGFIGYVQQEIVNIKNCEVTDNNITGENVAKQGAYIGTVNTGAVVTIISSNADFTDVGRILGNGSVIKPAT